MIKILVYFPFQWHIYRKYIFILSKILFKCEFIDKLRLLFVIFSVIVVGKLFYWIFFLHWNSKFLKYNYLFALADFTSKLLQNNNTLLIILYNYWISKYSSGLFSL